MKEIHTEIEISAPAEKVWRVLTDFAAYPKWNPLVRHVEGDVVVGSHPQVYIETSGGNGMLFSPTVLVTEPNRERRWLGHLWFPGLLDGEHSFVIEPVGNGHVRFIQRERFKGLLLPFLSKMLNVDIRPGFEEMNRALKLRAESAP